MCVSADRMEDLTPPELIRQNPKVDRTVSLYGFVRGIPLNKASSVHIPGESADIHTFTLLLETFFSFRDGVMVTFGTLIRVGEGKGESVQSPVPRRAAYLSLFCY